MLSTSTSSIYNASDSGGTLMLAGTESPAGTWSQAPMSQVAQGWYDTSGGFRNGRAYAAHSSPALQPSPATNTHSLIASLPPGAFLGEGALLDAVATLAIEAAQAAMAGVSDQRKQSS